MNAETFNEEHLIRLVIKNVHKGLFLHSSRTDGILDQTSIIISKSGSFLLQLARTYLHLPPPLRLSVYDYDIFIPIIFIQFIPVARLFMIDDLLEATIEPLYDVWNERNAAAVFDASTMTAEGG